MSSLGSGMIFPNCLSKLTIVVVEDHDDLRRYLGLFLGQVGTNVVVARNAFEGLEAIKNNHPNLVISDIKMPGVDGFKLLREIRVLGLDAGGSVPVIAMTAFVTHADHARILTAGFQESLKYHCREEEGFSPYFFHSRRTANILLSGRHGDGLAIGLVDPLAPLVLAVPFPDAGRSS